MGNSWLTSSRFVRESVTELWYAPALSSCPSQLIIISRLKSRGLDFASSSVVCHRHVDFAVRRSLFQFSCGLCYQRIPYAKACSQNENGFTTRRERCESARGLQRVQKRKRYRVSNQPAKHSNAKMATEEERAKIMAEYLAGADEDDGLGDFDPDDEVRTNSSVNNMRHPSIGHFRLIRFNCFCANGMDEDGLRSARAAMNRTLWHEARRSSHVAFPLIIFKHILCALSR